MFTKQFWIDTLERAIKTFCQSAVAFLIAGGAGVLNIDWVSCLSVAGLAFIVSFLTSVGSAGTGDKGTPSLIQYNKNNNAN